MTPREPHFETFADKAGGWRYRLRGGQGEIQYTSEAYTREADAARGAEEARVNSARAPIRRSSPEAGVDPDD